MNLLNGNAAHDQRWQRILDTIALKQPDRMPVALYATFWLAKYGDISCKQLMHDYDVTSTTTTIDNNGTTLP